MLYCIGELQKTCADTFGYSAESGVPTVSKKLYAVQGFDVQITDRRSPIQVHPAQNCLTWAIALNRTTVTH